MSVSDSGCPTDAWVDVVGLGSTARAGVAALVGDERDRLGRQRRTLERLRPVTPDRKHRSGAIGATAELAEDVSRASIHAHPTDTLRLRPPRPIHADELAGSRNRKTIAPPAAAEPSRTGGCSPSENATAAALRSTPVTASTSSAS